MLRQLDQAENTRQLPKVDSTRLAFFTALGLSLASGCADSAGADSAGAGAANNNQVAYCNLSGAAEIITETSQPGSNGVIRLGVGGEIAPVRISLGTLSSPSTQAGTLDHCEELIAARPDVHRQQSRDSASSFTVNTYTQLPVRITVKRPHHVDVSREVTATYLGRGNSDSGNIILTILPTDLELDAFEGQTQMQLLFPQSAPYVNNAFLETTLFVHVDTIAPRYAILPIGELPQWVGTTVVFGISASEPVYWGASITSPDGQLVTSSAGRPCDFFNENIGEVDNLCSPGQLCTLGGTGSNCHAPEEGGLLEGGNSPLRIPTVVGVPLPSGSYNLFFTLTDRVGNPMVYATDASGHPLTEAVSQFAAERP